MNITQQILVLKRGFLSALLVSGLALLGNATSVRAAEAEAAESEGPTYTNWIEFGSGGLILDGNKAAAAQRHSVRQGAFGGIEDFHWEEPVGKKATLSLDGRMLYNNHDYKGKLELINPDLGFIRGGFTEFRTYYNTSGGFYPRTAADFPLYNDPWAVDRGEAWLEGGLTLKKWPKLTLKYTHDFRTGEKGSTEWGTSHQPLVGGPPRGIVPSFIDISEHSDSFQADIRHTLLKTDWNLGLRYKISHINNANKVNQWPGEPVSTYLTDRQQVKSDMFNLHTYTVTRLSPKVQFATGYSFVTMDTDLGGSRIYGNEFDADYNPALASAAGFLALSGGNSLHEHTGNLNLMITPKENWFIVPSVRVQKQDLESSVLFTQTTTPAPATSTPGFDNTDRGSLDIAERLEARYTGVTNWVFYARGDWMQGQGNLNENGGPSSPVPAIARITDDHRRSQQYTLGASWYPFRRLHIDAQYYKRLHENDYFNTFDNATNTVASGNRYPAFIQTHSFDTDDANLRLTVHPRNNVTLVSRYDFQYSTISLQPDPVSGLGELESAKITSHIFSQNVTWVPWSRLFLQASFNYVLSRIDTPADQYTTAVLDGQNNYWTLGLSSGLNLDKKTDLTLNYFYYRANNGQYNTPDAVPFGAGAREHSITAGIVRKLKPNLRLSLKYGYFAFSDTTPGALNNYHAHLIYSTLQYRF